MTALYFVNTRTNRRYLVVRLDKEKGTITLRGEHAEFTEPYDKDRFAKLGYTLVKGEEHAVE